MYFVSLIALNVYTRKVRTLLTAFAIAVAIMTVITMGVLTHSLRRTAISILRTGTADFSVAQKDVSDVLYSALEEDDVQLIASYPEVQSAVGVLVAPVKLDSDHPFFLQLGLEPEQLEQFGVHTVVGRAYTRDASNEAMLGYRAARDLRKGIGDHVKFGDLDYEVVGIYQTGQVFGDSAAMLPLTAVQASERKPGAITLVFVQVKQGVDIAALRGKIEHDRPQLATVQSESDFGRVDRNLELISAANIGVSALALVIGAVSILNTMVLSVFERTREFGVLRAVGWTRSRVLLEVLGEAVMVSFAGAAAGVGAGFVAIRFLARTPALTGVFLPDYSADVFIRALVIAFAMAVAGALYPAARAALIVPLEAIRHE